jgi:hypothetical protein
VVAAQQLNFGQVKNIECCFRRPPRLSASGRVLSVKGKRELSESRKHFFPRESRVLETFENSDSYAVGRLLTAKEPAAGSEYVRFGRASNPRVGIEKPA